MKEHPILFSGEMVRALLAGRKSVTRRLSPQWMKVKAGDRLWVRETWAPHISHDGGDDPNPHYVKFRADGNPNRSPCDCIGGHPWPARWHPSIHMPRRASRILLEVEEDTRREPLHHISDKDAVLEGMESCTPADQFRSLWDSLHTKAGERWEHNPIVSRVGRFHRVPVRP